MHTRSYDLMAIIIQGEIYEERSKVYMQDEH